MRVSNLEFGNGFELPKLVEDILANQEKNVLSFISGLNCGEDDNDFKKAKYDVDMLNFCLAIGKYLGININNFLEELDKNKAEAIDIIFRKSIETQIEKKLLLTVIFLKLLKPPFSGTLGRPFLSDKKDFSRQNKEIFGVFPFDNIKKLLQKTFEALYKEKLEQGKISEEEVRQGLKKIKLAYFLAKIALHGKQRNSGKRYFDHAFSVALETLKNSTKPNLNKVILAILHDIIEDSEISFEIIQKLFGDEIALSISALSKKKLPEKDEEIKRVLENKQQEILTELKEKSISISYSHEISVEEEEKLPKYTQKLLEKLSIIEEKLLLLDNEELNDDDIEDIKFATDLSKNLIRKEYYSRFESIESLKRFIQIDAKEHGINLNDEQLNSIVKNIIVVKVSDRIDNLRDSEVRHSGLNTPENRKKAFRKIGETIKFYPILKEFCREFRDGDMSLLESLKAEVISLVSFFTKSESEKVLKSYTKYNLLKKPVGAIEVNFKT